MTLSYIYYDEKYLKINVYQFNPPGHWKSSYCLERFPNVVVFSNNFQLTINSIFPLTFKNSCKQQDSYLQHRRSREKNVLGLVQDSKKPIPQNVAYMEQEPCKCSAFKMQIHRRLIVSFFFFLNSQHCNSRSHMKKGSNSHKNRQI